MVQRLFRVSVCCETSHLHSHLSFLVFLALTYSPQHTCFFFSFPPTLSFSLTSSILQAPLFNSYCKNERRKKKEDWLPGNRSACCSQHHWMVSWRSQDWEVKSDYCPNKWRECVRGYGGTLWNCKTLHTTSGGGPLVTSTTEHWTFSVL